MQMVNARCSSYSRSVSPPSVSRPLNVGLQFKQDLSEGPGRSDCQIRNPRGSDHNAVIIDDVNASLVLHCDEYAGCTHAITGRLVPNLLLKRGRQPTHMNSDRSPRVCWARSRLQDNPGYFLAPAGVVSCSAARPSSASCRFHAVAPPRRVRYLWPLNCPRIIDRSARLDRDVLHTEFRD